MHYNHSLLLSVSYISLPKNEWNRLKNGKNHKNHTLSFSKKCHNFDILGKNSLNLLHLYLNRRLMGGFYSEFSPKVKRLGWKQNVWFSRKNTGPAQNFDNVGYGATHYFGRDYILRCYRATAYFGLLDIRCHG